MLLILTFVLVLVLCGILPVHSYSGQWGYFPSGIVGTVLFICLVMFLAGGRLF